MVNKYTDDDLDNIINFLTSEYDQETLIEIISRLDVNNDYSFELGLLRLCATNFIEESPKLFDKIDKICDKVYKLNK